MTKAGLDVAEQIAHLHGQEVGGEGAGIPPTPWKSGPSDLRFSHLITPQHHDRTRPACKPLTPGPWRYRLNTKHSIAQWSSCLALAKSSSRPSSCPVLVKDTVNPATCL